MFHLRDYIFDFFHNVNGTGNGLLKAVHADIQVPLFLAGCKVLGILNKMITAPLWRLTETTGHILDLCDVYSNLHTFIQEILTSDLKLSQFISCDISCFANDLISKDEIYTSLSNQWENDNITLSMMNHTLAALQQLISRVTADYLPGGKLHNLKDDIYFHNQTRSAPKHNKFPERIFGYLGYLISRRPNSSSIANEAQVMFVFNETDKFIGNLSPEERAKLVNSVIGRPTKELHNKVMERERKRHEELVKKQLEKQQQLEKSRKLKIKRKEDLTCLIIDAGLWQTR